MYQVEQKIGNHNYVYEAESYWDKTKKQPRQRRKLLGRKDVITGELVKTSRQGRCTPYKSTDFGTAYFLQRISQQLRIQKILKNNFPNDYEKILSLAYFNIIEGEAMYLASDWASYTSLQVKPQHLSSQRISELFETIGTSTDSIHNFFVEWIKKQGEITSIYFDITPISTYSKLLELGEWGYNRDGESLPQINLGLIYGEECKLPLYFKAYQGSIKDVSTLKNIVKYNKILGLFNITFILDKGFYSEDNLNNLDGSKIITSLPFSTKLSKILLAEAERKLQNHKNMFIDNERVYSSFKKTVHIGKGDDKSLRTIRVLKRNIAFSGSVQILDNKVEIDLFCLAVCNLRYIGTKRNRGFGHICCELYDNQKELTTECLNRLEKKEVKDASN